MNRIHRLLFLLTLAVGVGAIALGNTWAGEHAGEEHPGEAQGTKSSASGDDHAGKAASSGNGTDAKEHAGDHAPAISGADIKSAMTSHIVSRTESGKGYFLFDDAVTGESLELEFVKIHDPVRKIEGKGYFACTDFKPKGDTEGKLYDLDFWLSQKEGELVVTEERIHKHPNHEGDAWVKSARYTFVDDEPVVVP